MRLKAVRVAVIALKTNSAFPPGSRRRSLLLQGLISLAITASCLFAAPRFGPAWPPALAALAVFAGTMIFPSLCIAVMKLGKLSTDDAGKPHPLALRLALPFCLSAFATALYYFWWHQSPENATAGTALLSLTALCTGIMLWYIGRQWFASKTVGRGALEFVGKALFNVTVACFIFKPVPASVLAQPAWQAPTTVNNRSSYDSILMQVRGKTAAVQHASALEMVQELPKQPTLSPAEVAEVEKISKKGTDVQRAVALLYLAYHQSNTPAMWTAADNQLAIVELQRAQGMWQKPADQKTYYQLRGDRCLFKHTESLSAAVEYYKKGLNYGEGWEDSILCNELALSLLRIEPVSEENLSDAERFARIGISRMTVDECPIMVANLYNTLSAIHFKQSRFEDAAKSMETAVAIVDPRPIETPEVYWMFRTNLIDALIASRRYVDAVTRAGKIVAEVEKTETKPSWRLAEALADQAQALVADGQDDQAAEVMARAIAMLKQAFGNNEVPAHMRRLYAEYGQILIASGQYEKASEAFKNGLTELGKCRDPKSEAANTARAFMTADQAKCEVKLGHLQQAERLALAAFSETKQPEIGTDDASAFASRQLADVQLSLGQFNDAAKSFQNAIRWTGEFGHVDRAELLAKLAQVHAMAGDYQSASKQLQAAFTDLQIHAGHDPWRDAVTHEIAASIECRLEQYVAAEEDLKLACDSADHIAGPQNRYTQYLRRTWQQVHDHVANAGNDKNYTRKLTLHDFPFE